MNRLKLFFLVATVVLTLGKSFCQAPTLKLLLQYQNMDLQQIDSALTTQGWSFSKTSGSNENTDETTTVSYGFYNAQKNLQYILAYTNSHSVIRTITFVLSNPTEQNKIIAEAKAVGFRYEVTKSKNNRLQHVYKKGREKVIVFSTGSDENRKNNYYIEVYDAFDYVMIFDK
jgi:hypothetical protein